MKKSSKLIGGVVMSSALLSSAVIGMASTNDTITGTKVDMTLGLTASEDGKSIGLKLYDVSMSNSFELSLKLKGDVIYDRIDFNEELKSNSIQDVAYDTNTKVIKIVVTSTSDLVKGGLLDIGKLVVKGADGVEYEVNDNVVSGSPVITMVTPTFDEVYDDDLDIVGDTKITISSASEEEPPIVDDEEPSTNIGNGGTGGNNGTGGSTTEEVRPATKLVSLIGQDRYDTAIKVSQEGWKDGSKTVVIVNGTDKHLVDGLSASPLASIKDAPLLLSNNGVLTENTLEELERLNPSHIYIIGGENAMPSSIEKEIKKVISKVDITRLGGNTRFDTSLAIAKEIDKTNDISKIYVSGGYGEVDALSIAPVAGRDKSPIILTDVDALTEATYNFIKSENVEDAYFIGGETRISDKAIKQTDGVVSKNVSKNRIAGEDRQGTNAAVISKFYKNKDLKGVVITKDKVIVDALTVGSLATKYSMPVIIGEEYITSEQENVLKDKRSEIIYQVGGGTRQSIIERLKEILNNKK